jgi:ABC-type lipoprotein release transport system permease subunit
VTRVLILPGALAAGGDRAGRLDPVALLGVDPRAEPRAYRIRAGRDLLPGEQGLLVGTAVAARLGIAVGDG